MRAGVVAFEELRADAVQRQVDGLTLLAPTDVRVVPGRAVIVRGPNGAGKTTLLRMLTGMSRPSSGTVLLDGKQVDERRPRVRRVVAALLDPVAGYGHLTVQDHLVLVDQTWGADRDTCAARVETVLAELQVEPLRHRFLHELSSGQRQLVDLALTLIRPSGVLVLDEPEQRLDDDRRDLLIAALAARQEAGVALVVACHDDALEEALGDDVLGL